MSIIMNMPFYIICSLIVFAPLARGSVHPWATTIIQIGIVLAAIFTVIENFSAKKISLPVVERITTLTDQDPTDNISGRIRCWKGAILQIKDNPYLGTGPNTFTQAYPAWQIPGRRPFTPGPLKAGRPSAPTHQTVNLWISDIRARQRTNRNSMIIRLYRLGWTQGKIAKIAGLSRNRASEIVGNANICNIDTLLDHGRDMEYIAGHYHMDLALAWPIKTPNLTQPWLF